MTTNYIRRRVQEREKYYQFGEYFPFPEENSFDLSSLIRNNSKRIVLLGDAGYGKSTELGTVTVALIKEENPNVIPILIDLNTYTDEDLGEYIKGKIGKDSEELLRYESSKLVFLFDEFDQVTNKGVAERKINQFIERYNNSTFIIACRTNFYSGQFQLFKTYVLLPFNSEDIEHYVKLTLGNRGSRFLELLEQSRLLEIAKNPFFLDYLTQIYSLDNDVPRNRADIFSRILSLTLEDDFARLSSKYDIRDTYPRPEIERDLIYMALVMETLQRNFIFVEELNSIIPNPKRQIITELSILKKSFFKNGDVYQFQHNNFQEYFAARCLAEKSLNTILQFVSFISSRDMRWIEKLVNISKYIEIKPFGLNLQKVAEDLLGRFKYQKIDRINPSWVNTVAFLCQLRGKNDLFEYLKHSDPELTFKFEVSRVDERKREMLFKTIFEKYTLRRIWFDRDKVDLDELAHFAKTKDIYDYLMQFARSTEHFIYRYNSIQILGKMREFADESLHSLLIQYAKSQSENSNVRDTSLYALSWLGMVDSGTIEALKELKDSTDETVLSGYYYLITESSHTDDHVDILLAGIQRANRSSLVDLGWRLGQGIEKVKSVQGIRKIIGHFVNNPGDLQSFVAKRSINRIVNNMVEAFRNDESLYPDVVHLAQIIDEKHIDGMGPAIRRFFIDTSTTLRVFREVYASGIKENYSLLAAIADQDSINVIVDEYSKGVLTHDNVNIFLRYLLWKNKDNFDSFLDTINEKTQNAFRIQQRDYEKERREQTQRQIEISFDRREFLKEVEKIFEDEKKLELGHEDLERMLYHDEEQKYNDFVLRELMNYFQEDKDKKRTLVSLKAEIDNWNYEWFAVNHTFSLAYHGTQVVLLPEQKKVIENFCLSNLEKVQFREALKPKENGTTTSNLAIMLWYFFRKFDIRYPKEVLLDMLSFDWIEGSSFVGIDYLIEHLPFDEVKIRVLDNLTKGITIDRVLKNHINLCKKYQVHEAKWLLSEEVENVANPIETRLLALQTVRDLNIGTEYLEKLLDIKEVKIFMEVAKILIPQGNKKCRSKLLEKLDSGKGEFGLVSATLLIEEGDIEAIRFWANYIKAKKEFNVGSKSPFQAIRTVKAVPILLDLLKFSYENRGKIQQDEFNTLDTNVLNALRNIALQGVSNFNYVTKMLQKFIRNYGSKLENVNFLNIICDDIEKAFLASYHISMTLDLAKKKVDTLFF